MTSVTQLERLLDQNATERAAVSTDVARGQLRTAVAIRERLDQFGGAMLGDEVGAGKTFTTFAVIAQALLREPKKGAVIFVPSELLKRKWERQLKEYLRYAIRDRREGERLAGRVTTMGRSLRGSDGRPLRSNAIVIATHSVFAYRTSDYDRGVCLGAWLDKRCRAHRKPRSRLFKACGLSPGHDYEPSAVWAARDVLPSSALKALDEVWARWEAGDRKLSQVLSERVQDVRREAGRRLLPNAAVVVIDEAHNLRSTHSQIYKSLMHVLSGRFDALLFLTATPFQLGRSELRNIVEFFRYAKGYEDRVAEFDRRVAAMEAGMTAYIRALDAFGESWRLLDDAETDEARVLALGSDEFVGGTPRPQQAARRFRRCLAARQQLQDGLGPFLIRSVRARNHTEHLGLENSRELLAPESRIPLALVDRIITELLAARERTFIASALTSACSSWPALFGAAITGDRRGNAGTTRDLLMSMNQARILGAHPKVANTVDVCLQGIADGEKTLVFVERTETGKEIRDLVVSKLGQRFDRNARDRLQDTSRFGWPSLRENYLYTLYGDVFGQLPGARSVPSLLMSEYARDLWRHVDVEGPSRNYEIEKRFLEHVVFRAATSTGWEKLVKNEKVLDSARRILDPRYVVNGLDLVWGHSGQTAEVSSGPGREQYRDVNSEFAMAYFGYASPWASSTAYLRELNSDDRAELVDAAAASIAGSHLQVELASIDASGDPRKHFRSMTRLLSTPGTAWQHRFEAIASQAAELATVESDEGASDRVHGLASALRSNERVQFIHGQTKLATRINAVDGFNTPLYPEVVVATPILGEGLDLHRQCRRVVHHDLPWNPAKLEQRTGRIDRIGSMSERLAAANGSPHDASIRVWLPFMQGTYDETIFERVMARRREFRCILGSPPEWSTEDLAADEKGPAMDLHLVDALQVNLSPG
jgi:superfamily II DNA or RNA helicase